MIKRMKDSGIPWIGQIPEDWEKCFLKNSFNFEKGKNASLYTNEYLSDNKGEIPVYSGQTENDGIMGFVKDYDYFSTGCLFVTTVGAKAMTIKILQGKFCLSQNCLIMQEKKNININFWFYALQIMFDYEKSIMFGIMQPSLRIEDLKKYAIFLPNKDIQQKIVKILDKKCGQIDELIKVEENAIEKLKEYKTSLITKVVTKGLDANVKMKDSGIPWIGLIPHDWNVRRNKYVMTKEKEICTNYQNQDILSLTMKGVIKRDLENPSGKMPTTFSGYQYVKKCNLLLCLFDIDVTPRCVGVIKDNGLTSPAYSQYMLLDNNSPYYFNYLLGSIDDSKVFVHLSKNLRSSLTDDDYGSIYTICPPLQIQQQIVDYLDKKCEEIDNLLKVKQEKIEKLKEYKKSLIYQYVTGKKEVV